MGALVAALAYQYASPLSGDAKLGLLFAVLVISAFPFLYWYKQWEDVHLSMWDTPPKPKVVELPLLKFEYADKNQTAAPSQALMHTLPSLYGDASPAAADTGAVRRDLTGKWVWVDQPQPAPVVVMPAPAVVLVEAQPLYVVAAPLPDGSVATATATPPGAYIELTTQTSVVVPAAAPAAVMPSS